MHKLPFKTIQTLITIAFVVVIINIFYNFLVNIENKDFFSKIINSSKNQLVSHTVKSVKKSSNANKIKTPKSKKLEALSFSDFPEEDTKIAKEIISLFATGNYERCLNIAEFYIYQKNRSDGLLKWLKKQLDPILTALGWLKIREGKCDEAIELLIKSEKYKKTYEKAKGLAFCFFRNRALHAAEDRLTWIYSLKREPEWDLLLLQAEIYESRGLYKKSVEQLEKAYNITKDDALLKRLQAMKKRAKHSLPMQSISSRHFVVQFFHPQHLQQAEQILNTLDIQLDTLITNFHFREPSSHIEVVVYGESEFLHINSNAPEWAEALYDGRIRIPLTNNLNYNHLNKILKHELVHALFSRMAGFRQLPPWLDEGIAQYLSICRESCPSFKLHYKKDAFLQEKIFEKNFTNLAKILVSRAYRQSLYIILTLVEIYKIDGLVAIIESIELNSNLDSNSLLKPLETTFLELYNISSNKWKKGYEFENKLLNL